MVDQMLYFSLSTAAQDHVDIDVAFCQISTSVHFLSHKARLSFSDTIDPMLRHAVRLNLNSRYLHHSLKKKSINSPNEIKRQI